jgi:hypothetical protein
MNVVLLISKRIKLRSNVLNCVTGFTLDYQMVWSDCISAFKEQKLVLQEVLNSADCRISLTAATLNLNETLGYMCLTCHFISTDWKLQNRIIKFFVVEKPHNGVEMFSVILKFIQEWNIEAKIFGITLGNSAANDIMVDMLKHHLLQNKVLPVEGELMHNHCASHIINLIVNDGLRFVDPILSKLRESIKYIQSSQSRMRTFEEIIAEEDISYDDWPNLDTPTSWDSTYWMLDGALDFRSVFNSLALKDANYRNALCFDEWERAGAVCRLLKACYEATWTISRSCYTSNLYFHAIWKVKLALDGEASNMDNTVREMLKGMKKTFQKYWVQSYASLSCRVEFF